MGATSLTSSMLDVVFGKDSHGSSPEERAKSSNKLFVRSQDNLAIFSQGATGNMLSAWEALSAFGLGVLIRVVDEGVVPIVDNVDEPAKTLIQQREALGISKDALAKYLNISIEEVERAEDSRSRSPIEIIDKITNALALDDSYISIESGAKGDNQLTTRLRTLRNSEPHFNQVDVLKFADAAWVVRVQSKLMQWLWGNEIYNIMRRFGSDNNYGTLNHPAFKVGYELASNSRTILGIPESDSIPSMFRLCEEKLLLPLVKIELPERFAGATLSIGNYRGILVNINGMNTNVWVRRTTIAHELGHLLWDPEQKLQSIKIDDYDCIIEPDYEQNDPNRFVEQRANAFAVEFLCPRKVVRDYYRENTNIAELVKRVMTDYGVSFTTARFHIYNAMDKVVDWSDFQVDIDNEPSEEWRSREGYTEDFFPIESTPIERRGMFSAIVVRAHDAGYISTNTACRYLNCSTGDFSANKDTILSFYDLPE